jgi:hypothetical protein
VFAYELMMLRDTEKHMAEPSFRREPQYVQNAILESCLQERMRP